MSRSLGDRSNTILGLAKAPDGISSALCAIALGICTKRAAAYCSDLVQGGHLHRVKIPRMPMRFFASAATARA